MIIYHSGFLTLDFDPSTDILTVSLPPVSDILPPEISSSFHIIVDHVRNYDIKKLLFDAREAQVDVREDVFTPVISQFVQNLASTRVQKVARVISSSIIREHVVSKVFNSQKFPVQFESFSDIDIAIEWLKR